MSENRKRIISVKLKERSYDLEIGYNLLKLLPESLSNWLPASRYNVEVPGLAILVTDSNVDALFAEKTIANLEQYGWRVHKSIVTAGESAKEFSVVKQLYTDFATFQADRRTVVLALGGGVIGDLAGFVAATFARGLPYVQLPTSFLAMVDSSVGGKVGVNLTQGKNLVGAFHQPVGVLIDSQTLETLPQREFTSGLAEVVKYGTIMDLQFFEQLETKADSIQDRTGEVLEEIIAHCCTLKAQIVQQDEFERLGKRVILNYGHTVAHALEAVSEYGQFLHGEAVAIGMIAESKLAERFGMIDPEITIRQESLLTKLGLPTVIPKSDALTTDALWNCMMLDKKNRSGKLRFVLPTEIGHVEVNENVSREDVCKTIDAMRSP